MIQNRCRKGQEEIVGFVLVVALVMIIGIIFLGIAGRENKGNILESKEIIHFSESLMQTTTECSLRPPAQASLGELITTCYGTPGLKCDSGKGVCEAFNASVQQAMRASWHVGEGYPNTGYVLSAEHKKTTLGEATQFFMSAEGNCQGNSISGETLLREGTTKGTIVVRVKVCTK